MTEIQTKQDIMAQLAQVQQGMTDTLQSMTPAQFETAPAEGWSPAGYLKHVILSFKPIAKGIGLGKEKILAMFGEPDHASQPYNEVMARYQKRLSEGVRAEDAPTVLPESYRFPEGVADQKAYLTETWNEANQRLLTALEGWAENDLDQCQMPHPAVGYITVREMLYFALYHNTLHWKDIQALAE